VTVSPVNASVTSPVSGTTSNQPIAIGFGVV
jgi:hypothetical protein